MERFFVVKDQRLIGEYEKYKEMLQAMNKCFKDFAEKHGMRTLGFGLLHLSHVKSQTV